MRTKTALILLTTLGTLALGAPSRKANPNLPWPVEPWNIPADLMPVPRAALERLEVEGIPVHLRVEPRSPRLEATLLVRATTALPAERLALTFLLQHGGLEVDPGQTMAAALARLGVSLEVLVDPDLIRIRMSGPASLASGAQGTPAVLELLTKLARSPILSEKLLGPSRDAVLSLVSERKRDPLLLAQDELRFMVFQNHPYSAQITAEQLEALDPATLATTQALLFSPDRCSLSVAGPLDAQSVKSALEPLLSGWAAGEKPDRPPIPRPFESTQAKVIPVPVQGAAVVAGRSLIPSNLLERTAARILAAALDASLKRTFPPGSVGRVGASLEEFADAAFLQVWAEGAAVSTLDAVVRQEMARAGQGELGGREIEYARARAMARLLQPLDHLPGVVEANAALELLRGPQPADAGIPAEIELMRTLPASAVADIGRALLGRGAVALVTATPGGAGALQEPAIPAPAGEVQPHAEPGTATTEHKEGVAAPPAAGAADAPAHEVPPPEAAPPEAAPPAGAEPAHAPPAEGGGSH